MPLTYGTDPEFFLGKRIRGEEYITPPIDLRRKGLSFIPDLSERGEIYPHHIFHEDKEFTIFEDGAAFEFTIEPSKQMNIIFDRIETAREKLREIGKKFDQDLIEKPVARFDSDKIDDSDEEYLNCTTFGCDPDSDAFDLDYLCETLNVRNHEFRYAGGHIHIGGEKTEKKYILKYPLPFIKLLAVTIGNIVQSESKFPELDKFRARYYGKPGRFRLQKWGIEYRSPSNSWTFNSKISDKIEKGANYAFELLVNPEKGKEVLGEFEVLTVDAITSANPELSSYIVNELNIL